MSKFKMITGNVEKLILKDIFGLSSNSLSMTIERKVALDNEQIQKDIGRTVFFANNVSHENVTQRFVRSFNDNNKEGMNIYTQGDWDAGNYSIDTIRALDESPFTIRMVIAEQLMEKNLDSSNFSKNARVAFLNDQGTPCGLCLTLLRDDSDENVPVDERSFNYAVTIIQNVAGLPKDRTITYISHPSLFTANRTVDEIDTNDVLKIIREKLDSADLFDAIQPILLNKEIASKKEFDYFFTCAVPNTNCNTMLKRLDSCSNDEEKTQFCQSLTDLRTINHGYFFSYFNKLTMEQIDAKNLIAQVTILKNFSPEVLETLSTIIKTESSERSSALFADIRTANEKHQKNILGIKIGSENILNKKIADIKNNSPEMELAFNQSPYKRNKGNLNGLFGAIVVIVAVIVAAALFASPLGIFTLPLATAVFGAIALGAAIVGIFTGKKAFDKERSVSNYITQRDSDISNEKIRTKNEKETNLGIAKQKFNKTIEQIIAGYIPKADPNEDLEETDSIEKLYSRSFGTSPSQSTPRSDRDTEEDSISITSEKGFYQRSKNTSSSFSSTNNFTSRKNLTPLARAVGESDNEVSDDEIYSPKN